jgi:hypothetical protein
MSLTTLTAGGDAADVGAVASGAVAAGEEPGPPEPHAVVRTTTARTRVDPATVR